MSLGMFLTAACCCWASKLMPESTEGCFLSLSLITCGGSLSSLWSLSPGSEPSLRFLMLAKAERRLDVVPRGPMLWPQETPGICNCLSRLGARMKDPRRPRCCCLWTGLTKMTRSAESRMCFDDIRGSICSCLFCCSSFSNSSLNSGQEDMPASWAAVSPAVFFIPAAAEFQW